MEFECVLGEESWIIEVDLLSFEDLLYELFVWGRGTKFHILIGRYLHGSFMCIPNLGIGCELADDLSDTFWNRESIGRHLNEVDTATLVCAISKLSWDF